MCCVLCLCDVPREREKKEEKCLHNENQKSTQLFHSAHHDNINDFNVYSV